MVSVLFNFSLCEEGFVQMGTEGGGGRCSWLTRGGYSVTAKSDQ